MKDVSEVLTLILQLISGYDCIVNAKKKINVRKLIKRETNASNFEIN